MYSFCTYYAINTFEFPQILRGKGLNRRLEAKSPLPPLMFFA